jgi:hypothetical protein
VAGSRFGYYARLSSKEKATYRKSDDAPRIVLPHASALAPAVKEIEDALLAGKRVRVAKAVTALGDAICDQLAVARVRVHVRETRPALGEGAELHGLYTFADEDDGTPAKIEVWMKTHAQGKVVRFRTFLRTLVHEIVHHLDVVLLELDDSFHTEGFFRRESGLVRQLLPIEVAPSTKAPEPAPPPPPPPRQLSLFG